MIKQYLQSISTQVVCHLWYLRLHLNHYRLEIILTYSGVLKSFLKVNVARPLMANRLLGTKYKCSGDGDLFHSCH